MNIEQSAQQAVNAAAVAESHIAHLVKTLNLETVGEKLGVKMLKADKTSIQITVLS